MKAFLLAVGAMLAFAGPAAAADWSPVVTDPQNEFVIGVDGSSLRSERGFRVGWLIFAYRTARTRAAGDYDYILREVEFDCAAKTQNLRRSVFHRLGEPAPMDDLRQTTVEFSAIAPGSIGARVLNAACGFEALKPALARAADDFVASSRAMLREKFDRAAAPT